MYSKEYAEDNLDVASRLFKLTIEIQDRKVNKMCNEMVYSSLSKTDASKKLKLHNYTRDAKNTMINNDMARKNKLEEVHFKHSKYEHPAFVIRRINNFYCDSFTGSPMHNLGLGLACSIMLITFQFTSL